MPVAKGKEKRRLRRWIAKRAESLRKSSEGIRRVASDTGLVTTGLLLLGACGIWLVWHYAWPDLGRDYQVEFIGLIFDIVFILIVLALLQYGGQRRQAIARQEEIIEDYKRWDSEEARFRIAGALRRLNRLGVTAVDFTGVQLSKFKFAESKIQNISGSTFFDGSWGEPFKSHEVDLRNVSFDWLQCQKVQFSPYNPLQGFQVRVLKFATFTDCSFRYCKLNGSSFSGAHLLWTKPPPASLFEDAGYDDDGVPILVQAHHGPFEGAELEGVSFREVHFVNADFRNALNVNKADFTNATGLESCVFDEDALANDVLREAGLKIG